ncbi:MAG TPA: glycoside hydrolase family 43 protein [Acidimicrobiales bacterium]
MPVLAKSLKIAVGVLVAVAAAVVVAGRIDASSRSAAAVDPAPPRPPALPLLGPIQSVDSNDVGDPFILPVPAGVQPPTDVPYQGPGPDAYASGPWSKATAESAVSHGWYVLFGTTDWQGNVPTAISTDGVHWTQAPDSLPVLPKWAAPSITMTWAPAAQRTSSGWVLYYSTEEQPSGLECIGRAISSSPAGPYRDQTSSPMLCQRNLGGSIDPSVVRASDGSTYLVWKTNGNAVHVPTSIWSQQLSSDGLSLRGEPHRLLGDDAPWELGNVEAPAMVAAPAGGYWLFYAGGVWSRPDGYATGLAYCSTLTGPCQETSTKPFLATTANDISPGGLDTFTDLHGRLWAAFTGLVPVPSTRHPGHVYYNRVLDVAPFLAH